MHLLVLTTLFPNAEQPQHGIFVETRLRQLIESREFSATVIAPVPWFPFAVPGMLRYSQYSRVPRVEQRHGIEIFHPRYLAIPKIGFIFTPIFLALSLWVRARALLRSGQHFDAIDAHYFYPDGVSAVLSMMLSKIPVVITARGSDINLLPNFTLPRLWIMWAFNRASASITVSSALKSRMVALGMEPGKIHVVPNGVDGNKYFSKPEDGLEDSTTFRKKTLLSVGNLVKLKGHDLVIRSMVELPEYYLRIAGDGKEKKFLHELAVRIGVIDRVEFLGAVVPDEMPSIYRNARLTILASEREGMPNVLLESMSCGTPVIATRVGGVPEIVFSPEAGIILEKREVPAIVAAVRKWESTEFGTEATALYARQFCWDHSVSKLRQIFFHVCADASNNEGSRKICTSRESLK